MACHEDAISGPSQNIMCIPVGIPSVYLPLLSTRSVCVPALAAKSCMGCVGSGPLCWVAGSLVLAQQTIFGYSIECVSL